jgi:hypothetical protein
MKNCILIGQKKNCYFNFYKTIQNDLIRSLLLFGISNNYYKITLSRK